MVTKVPVDSSYEYPRTELTAMSDNIAWLIGDIDKLNVYRKNMMDELKVLLDITMFYNMQHPEWHSRTDPGNLEEEDNKKTPGQHREVSTEGKTTDEFVAEKKKTIDKLYWLAGETP